MKSAFTLLGFTAFLLSATWTNVLGQKAEVSNFYGVADPVQQTVALSWWAIGDETFVSQIIEFSADGVSFRPVAEIPVTGGENGQSYRYNHMTPVIGINYYRIALMFKDGNHIYSQTIKVDFRARPILSSAFGTRLRG
jgi:hypothetical protein